MYVGSDNDVIFVDWAPYSSTHDEVEEERMRKTAVESLADESIRVTLINGHQATVDAFKAQSHAFRLLEGAAPQCNMINNGTSRHDQCLKHPFLN